MNIEAIIRDCDRKKYDSVALFPEVATAFPDQISWRLGLDYETQDRLVAALKSGKYVRAIFYKNQSKKMEITLNTKEKTMSTAINAKFKKGDRVIYVATGERGVVKSNYAPYEYAVRFDGDRTDTWIAEEKLRAANCATANSVVAKAVANARAANASAEPTVAKNKEYDPEFPRKMREYTDSFEKRGRDAMRKIDQAKALFENAVSGYLSECIKWEKAFVNLYQECGFNYDAAIRSGAYVAETTLRDALIKAEDDMRRCVAQISKFRGAV